MGYFSLGIRFEIFDLNQVREVIQLMIKYLKMMEFLIKFYFELKILLENLSFEAQDEPIRPLPLL